MWKIIEEIRNFVNKIEKEKGSFNLFAMLKLNNPEESWEIYVDADWFDESVKENIIFILNNIINKLPKAEILKINKIVPVKKNNPIIQDLKNIKNQIDNKTKKYYLEGYDDIEIISLNYKKLFNQEIKI